MYGLPSTGLFLAICIASQCLASPLVQRAQSASQSTAAAAATTTAQQNSSFGEVMIHGFLQNQWPVNLDDDAIQSKVDMISSSLASYELLMTFPTPVTSPGGLRAVLSSQVSSATGGPRRVRAVGAQAVSLSLCIPVVSSPGQARVAMVTDAASATQAPGTLATVATVTSVGVDFPVLFISPTATASPEPPKPPPSVTILPAASSMAASGASGPQPSSSSINENNSNGGKNSNHNNKNGGGSGSIIQNGGGGGSSANTNIIGGGGGGGGGGSGSVIQNGNGGNIDDVFEENASKHGNSNSHPSMFSSTSDFQSGIGGASASAGGGSASASAGGVSVHARGTTGVDADDIESQVRASIENSMNNNNNNNENNNNDGSCRYPQLNGHRLARDSTGQIVILVEDPLQGSTFAESINNIISEAMASALGKAFGPSFGSKFRRRGGLGTELAIIVFGLGDVIRHGHL